jgi:methionyl-tRNA formyltransferase
MKIGFIGSVAFSESVLHHLIAIGPEADAEVVAVCTLESAPFNADHVDLTPVAAAQEITVRYTPDINAPDVCAWLAEKGCDVVFCFGWSRLVGPDLLALPRLGVVGFHPAALPANRGRHPIIWALALGLEETASSFFFMSAGADTGDVLSQVPVAIAENDDAADLYAKITERALDQISAFVPQLADGSFSRRPQDETRANAWRKRGLEDGRIDWRMSARNIHNLVRALAQPYVGAHFVRDGSDCKVWKTAIVETAPVNAEPGKVLAVSPRGVDIKCGSQAIRLLETEPVGTFNVGDYL